MSERRTIVYAGGFVLPAGNASAQRALENARVLRSLGYDVVIVGQLMGEAAGRAELEVDGVRCLDIHAAGEGSSYYKNSARSLLAVIEGIGPERVHAVIAYNYPALPLIELIAFGRRHGVPIVQELTEWYGWEGTRIRSNLRKLAESELRMRVLAPISGNLLCTSDWGTRRYRGANAMTLPWIVDETAPKWAQAPWPRDGNRRRFVYVGSPGQGLVKDFLHLVIAAFADLARAGADFDFQVAGVTAADVIGAFPRLSDDIAALGDRISLHGRLPHEEAVRLLKSADFSVFVRPDNRISRFGFPTKLAEAFACGTPSITNPTSDIARYVQDGSTGILLAGPQPAAIAEGLSRALALGEEEMTAMKARVGADNPFAPAKWREPLAAFFGRLR